MKFLFFLLICVKLNNCAQCVGPLVIIVKPAAIMSFYISFSLSFAMFLITARVTVHQVK